MNESRPFVVTIESACQGSPPIALLRDDPQRVSSTQGVRAPSRTLQTSTDVISHENRTCTNDAFQYKEIY